MRQFAGPSARENAQGVETLVRVRTTLAAAYILDALGSSRGRGLYDHEAGGT